MGNPSTCELSRQADRNCIRQLDFDEMVRGQWGRIFALITKYERDRDTARDLTQECFWNAWRGWQNLRQEASLPTWLSHIAVNIVRNHARRQGRRARLERDPSNQYEYHSGIQSSPEAALLLNEQIHAIWHAAQFVSMQQLTAFRLRFLSDLTTLEIAGVMGISEGAVKGHIFRAVQTIRKVLRSSRSVDQAQELRLGCWRM
jgi:RNA polymerase sigma-70 factor (ECF subfamily)